MRPLDRLPSIKLKLGVVIVAAVFVTVAVVVMGLRAGTPTLFVAGVAVVAALLMVQVLARGMTSPLRDMASAARAMARGDYGQRVRETSRDEVGELARAFNRMAADLAETERMKRDLIANVSHDLRTPIGALQAVLENLIDGVVEPDPATLAAMLDQTQRLGRLVAQLLDLSRFEAGTIILDADDFDLAPFLDEAIRPFQLNGSDVRFETRVEPADLTIRGDRERLQQAVVNLVDNATRFSPPGGLVRLTGIARASELRMIVEDEGPGLPTGPEEEVFERFYRGDDSRSEGAGGAGLGLAIARWIVELHGGAIRAEPGAAGGTRVVIQMGSGR